ncbi:MAG: hypothetical protein EXR72_05730 [Myxococcales bacterium]|nr:hypothetical protein [Myxococcales bacterium]
MAKGKRSTALDLPLPVYRTVAINFRLTEADAADLRTLAKGASVGHTTLARVIIEKYVADHRPTKRGRV